MARAKRVKALPLAMLCASALLAIGVLTFAGPCVHDDGSHGACFAASIAIMACALAGLAFSIAALLCESPTVNRIAAICAAAAGAFSAFAPGTLFPLCMMQTMRCWMTMRPFALVCGLAIAALGIVTALVATGGTKRARR